MYSVFVWSESTLLRTMDTNPQADGLRSLNKRWIHPPNGLSFLEAFQFSF